MSKLSTQPADRNTKKGWWARLVHYVKEGIWVANVDEMKAINAVGIKAARVAWSTVLAYDKHAIGARAAALTYFTTLSLVPLLALAFSILKGFGAYEVLLTDVIEPYLQRTFGGQEQLLRASSKVLEFVRGTDVSSLGTFGMVFLLYTSIMLLSNVEAAFNKLWTVRRGRHPLRRLTDYLTVVVLTPVLLLLGSTLATGLESSRLLTFIRESLALGVLVDFVLRLTSWVVVVIALAALYMIMPNLWPRFRSAFLGALVGGTLWQVAIFLHVQLQIGVARYNALYSSFSAFPIFMVWLYVSWITVLVGAAVAVSHQNLASIRQQRTTRVDPALREVVGLTAATEVARALVCGTTQEHATVPALAKHLQVPADIAEDVLEQLVGAGLFARTLDNEEQVFVPVRDLNELRVKDILDALRYAPESDAPAALQASPTSVSRVFENLQRDMSKSQANLTLRELADLEP